MRLVPRPFRLRFRVPMHAFRCSGIYYSGPRPSSTPLAWRSLGPLPEVLLGLQPFRLFRRPSASGSVRLDTHSDALRFYTAVSDPPVIHCMDIARIAPGHPPGLPPFRHLYSQLPPAAPSTPIYCPSVSHVRSEFPGGAPLPAHFPLERCALHISSHPSLIFLLRSDSDLRLPSAVRRPSRVRSASPGFYSIFRHTCDDIRSLTAVHHSIPKRRPLLPSPLRSYEARVLGSDRAGHDGALCMLMLCLS